MIQLFRNILRPRQSDTSPAIPAGERVYAVGDIHGRSDLFSALIGAIDADDASRGSAMTTVILLGDLVDRGPDSAGVLELARNWQHIRKVRIIAGNHEEIFLDAFDDTEVLRHFLQFGGRETILSYPVDPTAYASASLAETQGLMRAAVPETDLAFIRSFDDRIAIGDYLFVHAGIRPGVPLDQQKPQDMRWIRQTFVDHDGDHGAVVVHGHTISEEPQFRPNRIGIDTGAYASGRLTALGLEGTSRWLLETQQQQHDGAIRVTHRSIS